MPTIGTSSKPAYVYDAGTDTWIPIGPGEHTHDYVEKSTLTTTGDLVYASAANTPARLGIGSTDQVLTVSGGVPSWATPTSGSMTQLATGSFSGTNLQLAGISTDYKDLKLVIQDWYVATGDNSLYFQLNNKTSNNYQNMFFRTGTTTITTDLDNAVGYMGVGQQRNSDSNSFAILTIFDYANTNSYKLCQGMAYSRRTDGSHMLGYSQSALTDGTGAITEIDIFASASPTMSQGTYYLYGVK